MKKLRVPKKKTGASVHHRMSHESRRITMGVALVLLGVLIVLNLLAVSHSYQTNPVQGTDIVSSQ